MSGVTGDVENSAASDSNTRALSGVDETCSESFDRTAATPSTEELESSSYPREVLALLETLWRQQKLCDVEIEIPEEGTLKAHRVMLAAASQYFCAMFTSDLKECKMKRIPIRGVDMATMRLIIEFAYTGKVTVNEENVHYLLLAANMFQVRRVTNACCRFLETQLDPSNCIGIADLALQQGMAELYNQASIFIEKHFSTVSKLDEFLSLPCQTLVALLRKDALNVCCETEVFEAVLRWVRHDEVRRGPDLQPILRAVRCHFLAPEFLQEQVSNCSLVRSQPKCSDYLSKVIQDLNAQRKHSCCIERRSNIPNMIYVVGGYLRRSLRTTECFSTVTNTWTALARLPLERSGPGGIFMDGHLYVVGGRVLLPPRDLGEDISAVHSFDPSKNVWRQRCSMSTPRHRLGVAVLGRKLYAIAGSNGTQCLSSVERYDPEHDEWTQVANLAMPRYGLGTVAVGRHLYAIGGCNSTSKFGTVEKYHPETDRWETMTPLRVPRSGAGTVALGKYIYVIGGYDGLGQVDSVERYNTDTDTWDAVASLNTRRSALSATVLDGKIYALGGYDGEEYLSTVEIYDPKKNEWTPGVNMLSCKSGHASCTSHAPCFLHGVIAH